MKSLVEISESDDQFGPCYLLRFDDGSVYLQRKDALQPTDRLTGYEEVIIALCERLVQRRPSSHDPKSA